MHSIRTHPSADREDTPPPVSEIILKCRIDIIRHTEERLAKVIVGMTISLDGFVADQNGNAGRLYHDLVALRHTAYRKDLIDQTGAPSPFKSI